MKLLITCETSYYDSYWNLSTFPFVPYIQQHWFWTYQPPSVTGQCSSLRSFLNYLCLIIIIQVKCHLRSLLQSFWIKQPRNTAISHDPILHPFFIYWCLKLPITFFYVLIVCVLPLKCMCLEGKDFWLILVTAPTDWWIMGAFLSTINIFELWKETLVIGIQPFKDLSGHDKYPVVSPWHSLGIPVLTCR